MLQFGIYFFSPSVWELLGMKEVQILKDFRTFGAFAILMARFVTFKVVFIVDILRNRLEMCQKKIKGIRDFNFKILVLLKLHEKSWKLVQMLNKYYCIQVITSFLQILSLFLIFGILMAIELFLENGNWASLGAAVVPFYGVLFICYSCHNCCVTHNRIASFLMSLNGEKFLEEGIIEAFTLQIQHQRISFEPANLFEMNYELIIEIVLFVLSYDIVVLQFYLL